MQYILFAFLGFVLVMSIISFGFYAADKGYAKKGRRRVPEKVLLSLGFFGGASGALIAMKAVRHKTKHWYFWVINVLGLVWQIALTVFLIINLLR